MVPVVSVIIPVYNAAAFLEQCIESVLAQSLWDIEVIAVNDGSTDASGVILDRLAATNERLRVFHQPNKGVSAARNFGLDQAKGTYIGFCDADDYVDHEMYRRMIAAAKENACDWVICNVQLVGSGGSVSKRLALQTELIDIQMNRGAVLQNLMQFVYDNANWNKLYDGAIIRKHQLRFNEQLKIGEDLFFNLQYLAFANRLFTTHQTYYYYRVHPHSVMASTSNYPVSQLVCLSDAFHQFSVNTFSDEERLVFSKEITRIVYYQVINQLWQEAAVTSTNPFRFILHFRRLLLGLQSITLVFNSAELSGFSGFKKWLLLRKQYVAFSVLSLVRKAEAVHA